MRILWVPHAAWHFSQRAGVFCRALAHQNDVHVTNWVADFFGFRDYLHPRYLQNFYYRRSSDHGITVHGIPRISPALFIPALRRLNAIIFRWFVERIVITHHIEVVVATFVVPPPRVPRLVFDLFDENGTFWAEPGKVPAYAREIIRTEEDYLQQADAVVAASQVLVEKAAAVHSRETIYLIPNGVDLRRFDNLQPAPYRAQWVGYDQVVGSVGNHDSDSELEKILQAARQLADKPMLFVVAGRGSAIPTAQRKAQAMGLTNIRFTGYISPDEAPHLMSALDVGLCPYRKTPMDDARSPMRLLMYAAVGLPTVCTNLAEVQRMNFPNVVLVEDDATAFAEGIRAALHMPRQQPAEVQSYDVPRLVEQYVAVLAGK
jgi:glycosyltransferase involved in cell wall biosynthesis